MYHCSFITRLPYFCHYLFLRSGKEPNEGNIATFNVDHKSGKDLRQYLTHIADQCETK